MYRFTLGLSAGLMLALGEASAAAAMWEAGRLDYINGNAEVAAFVNTAADTQLQVVLCAKNEPQEYRVTLLLPHVIDALQIFEVQVECDGITSSAFAELNGNSLEFQLDGNVYASLPDSPTFTVTFNPADAALLGLEPVLSVPMIGASQVLSGVASECTVLCLNDDFKCRKSLVSSVLWPRQGFSSESESEVNRLCVRAGADGEDELNLSRACRLVLDRFYEREGQGSLSFLHELFTREDGSFASYVEKWNQAVGMMANGPVGIRAYADDAEWYLTLFTLAGGRQIKEQPLSYHRILKHPEDPTTLIYDIENRYEMENLKYTSVLMRRNQSSLSIMSTVEAALKEWQDFYREFTYILPDARQAQALRPIIFRQMLMRVWRMAGMPQGLNYRPEFAFVQGTGGQTVTKSPLEEKCAYFEGVRQDEFFYPSSECLESITSGISHQGFKNSGYDEVMERWRSFAKAWQESLFSDEADAEDGGQWLEAGVGLPLLSMYRIFGFGDYFLMRSCISTRDSDICALESRRLGNQLNHEYHNKLASILAVSRTDGKDFAALQKLWQDYQDALSFYLNHEVMRGALPLWRAELVKGVSAAVRTDAVISAPYREEMPDVTLEGSEDDFEEASELEKNSEIIDSHQLVQGSGEHLP